MLRRYRPEQTERKYKKDGQYCKGCAQSGKRAVFCLRTPTGEKQKSQAKNQQQNFGKADKNQLLSEARANSLKAFLVSKGVDEARLIAAGFGSDKQLADNKTAAGRSKNRRVEMTVRNF